MMKVFATLALMTGSSLAFAPSTQNVVRTSSLNAEKSQSLPFMNRPPLVRDPHVIHEDTTKMFGNISSENLS
jgi:hypothetical protein